MRAEPVIRMFSVLLFCLSTKSNDLICTNIYIFGFSGGFYLVFYFKKVEKLPSESLCSTGDELVIRRSVFSKALSTICKKFVKIRIKTIMY